MLGSSVIGRALVAMVEGNMALADESAGVRLQLSADLRWCTGGRRLLAASVCPHPGRACARLGAHQHCSAAGCAGRRAGDGDGSRRAAVLCLVGLSQETALTRGWCMLSVAGWAASCL